ncbi:hypothetical protein AB0B25_25795 [Nocardia sp. NPDC049190]|uniref:hypothetical protein n=1 Tax=Nocardia sp. NPDC049190 TaxID=3155650 RepID=UPI0033E3D414
MPLWTEHRDVPWHTHGTGEYAIADLAELFAISRPFVCRTLQCGHAMRPAGDTITNGNLTLPTDMRGSIA